MNHKLQQDDWWFGGHQCIRGNPLWDKLISHRPVNDVAIGNPVSILQSCFSVEACSA